MRRWRGKTVFRQDIEKMGKQKKRGRVRPEQEIVNGRVKDGRLVV